MRLAQGKHADNGVHTPSSMTRGAARAQWHACCASRGVRALTTRHHVHTALLSQSPLQPQHNLRQGLTTTAVVNAHKANPIPGAAAHPVPTHAPARPALLLESFVQ